MDEKTTGTHLFLVLWKAASAVRRVAEANIQELGLGLTDFAVLEALLHKGPLAVNAIGRKVLLTSGSITTAIDRLEKRGLVERRDDLEDRRARIVHLTEPGRSLISCAFERHAARLEELAGTLTRQERADLVRTVRKFGLAAGKIL